jgi:hypothetical protein
MKNKYTPHFICLFSLLIISSSLAQYPNIRIDGPQSDRPEEVTITINPVNPEILAAGANISHYYYSTDGGETWTPALRVNDDNSTRHQFFPWMTVDQSTGTIWGVFYDRRNTTGVATDVYVVKSTNGGDSFENFKVSESSFVPNSFVFFGDYNNIAAYEGKIYPIWTRLHGGQLSIWNTIIYDASSVSIDDEISLPHNYVLFQNYPNPFNPTTTISYQLPEAGFVTVKVFDVLGNEITTLVWENKPVGVHEINFDGSDLSSGIYLYQIDAGAFHQSKKMMLVK